MELKGVSIEGELLDFAVLKKVDLSTAHLNNTWFVEAELDGASLCAADLRGCNLSRSKLRKANLERADLRDANLSYADLSEANLTEARLANANLKGARLSGANLSYCDLEKARFLEGFGLEGANLKGASVPKSLDFGALSTARMCAGYARRLFAAQVVICAYLIAFLVVTSPSPVGLEQVPFFPVKVNVTWVPILSAWIAAAIAANFRYYLARTWDHMSLLPAVSPEGLECEDYVDPWFVTSYSRLMLDAPGVSRAKFEKIEAVAAGTVAYLLVPITLFAVATAQSSVGYFKSALVGIPLLWSGFGGLLGLWTPAFIHLIPSLERQKVRAIVRLAEFVTLPSAAIIHLSRYTIWEALLFLRQLIIEVFS